MIWRASPPPRLSGTVPIPGDKSISHRALLLATMAEGLSEITGLLEAEDCLRTLTACRELGAHIQRLDAGHYVIQGPGWQHLKEPEDVLDCGNSGTTIRLLMGALAPQSFTTIFTGDHSLRSRPMGRVVHPLTDMGARFVGRKNASQAPLALQGGTLEPIMYHLPMASAQVKSALLLAALQTEGTSRISEPLPSRNHTELMLRGFGAELDVSELTINIKGPQRLYPQKLRVPADFSSAAFFLVAAILVPGSHIQLPGIGINPTRTGLLEVLTNMGACIQVTSGHEKGGEAAADLTITSSGLNGVLVDASLIPRLVDEVPILAVAATQAHGITEIQGAAELRVKESDRLAAMANGLKKMGAKVEERPDGLIIEGPTPLHGAEHDAHGDHRIAMAFTVAGLIAKGETVIKGVEAVQTSFPEFADLVAKLGAPLG